MRKKGSPFGVNTYSYMYGYKAIDCLRHLMDQGYADFELMMFPGHIWPSEATAGQRTAVRSFASVNGLKITGLNQPNMDINIAGATPEMRDYSLQSIRNGLELAADIDCKTMIIGPGKPNMLLPLPRAMLLGWFHDALETLLPIGRRLGVEILVENMPMSILPTAGELVAALNEHGDDSVGIAYDIANAAFIKEDIIEGLATLGSRLKVVHLSDTCPDRPEHRAFGTAEGIVPLGSLAGSLARMEVRPQVVFEIISTSPDRDLRQSEEAMRAYEFYDVN